MAPGSNQSGISVRVDFFFVAGGEKCCEENDHYGDSASEGGGGVFHDFTFDVREIIFYYRVCGLVTYGTDLNFLYG